MIEHLLHQESPKEDWATILFVLAFAIIVPSLNRL
jgi:hypothetical protein